MDDDALRTLLRDQNGALTRSQASGCGMSSAAIGRRVAHGDWELALPRLLRAKDRPDDPRERVRRAGLWAGERGTVCGAAAAVWWRLHDEVPRRITVVRAPERGGRAPEGIALRRRLLDEQDRLRVDGIMVTKGPRTVLDAAVELGPVEGARLVDRALQRGEVGIDALREVLTRTTGMWGVVAARELVALADGGARSEAERRTVRGLRRAGLRAFVVNLETTLPGWGPAVLDIAFPATRLVIEIQGSTPIGGGPSTATSTGSATTRAGRTPSCSPAGSCSG